MPQRRRRPAAGVVGQTRLPGEVAALIAAPIRRPKGPQVSGLASSSSTCMVNSPIRFMALIQFRLHRIALALLERGADPADRFLAWAHCSSRTEISTPNWRGQKLHRLVTQKPQNDLHAGAGRHRPSLAIGVIPGRCGPAGKAWPGENVDEPSSPAFTTGPPINSNSLLEIISSCLRSSLDTSIKRNSVSKQKLGSDSANRPPSAAVTGKIFP